MFFTQHAIERFRQRFAPGLPHSHCLRELKVLGASAHRLKERTRTGELQLEVSDGSGAIFVLKGDVCVTVLYGREDEDESDPLGGAA